MLIGVPLLTVTLIVDEVPTLFAASYAFATSVCAPFVAVVVFQLHAYGDVVSVDCNAPSSRNSTFVTATLSLAFAVTLIVALTIALFAGAVIDTVGAVVSPPPAESLCSSTNS
jgi:hypothetical protein